MGLPKKKSSSCWEGHTTHNYQTRVSDCTLTHIGLHEFFRYYIAVNLGVYITISTSTFLNCTFEW